MSLVALALLAATPVASDIPVQVGRFDPSEFPEVVELDRRMPNAEMVRRVETILSEGQCTIEGAHDRRFNIVVPYALQMEPDGFTNVVVVQETGCAPLEVLAGQILLAQIERGDFQPQHEDGERWYVGELGFALNAQSEAVAMSQEDPDAVICRMEEPEVGSRLRMERICLTAAGWRQYDSDRAQLRRDIGAAAKCGNPRCMSE